MEKLSGSFIRETITQRNLKEVRIRLKSSSIFLSNLAYKMLDEYYFFRMESLMILCISITKIKRI